MPMQISIDTAEAAPKLGAMSARLRRSVRGAFETLAAELVSRVRGKLSGEVLEPRTGALRAGIAGEIVDGSNAVAARVFSGGSVPYARIQEFGGRIAIPGIAPQNAKALAFAYDGKLAFAAHTAAHVANMPERSYLRSSLADFAPALLEAVRKLAADSLA